MILTDKKRFLKMKNVQFINAPAYDEFAVKNLYAKVIKMPGMASLFPDKYPKGRQCCREYMYNVWNSIHPNEVKAVIDYANSQRYSVVGEKQKEKTMQISESWKEELELMPFISKQKGRMSHLLKEKSKVAAFNKQRVTYDAWDFIPVKKQKDKDGNVTEIKQHSNISSAAKAKIVPKIISKDVKMREKS